MNYGDKAAFNIKTRGVKAYFQAKGSTTPRSFVGGKQIMVETDEISARPAINVMDLRTGRINMADLIKSANDAMTEKKIKRVEQVLHAGIQKFASPFYGTGTGVDRTVLNKQIEYYRRLGPVTLLGDYSAANQVAQLTGMAVNSTDVMRSNEMYNEYNNNGFLGNYNGCRVAVLQNAYEEGSTKPVLETNWLYILPGNQAADMRNLKIVNEGSVQAMEAQDINDLVFEIRLDQQFGAAFVTGEQPTIGAYCIN